MARSLMLCSALLLILAGTSADAHERYMAQMPNAGLVERNGVAWPAVGHVSADGNSNDDENQFGKDWEDIGNDSWNKALCQHDSDGDGQTNGYELGDPDCTWTIGAVPNRTCCISHPAYSDSMAVITPAPPTTPAPTQAVLTDNATITITSSAVKSVLGGKYTYQWTIDAATNDLLITFVSAGDYYVSLGVGPSQMNGPMITCYVNAAGTAKCSDWEGLRVAITATTAFSSIVSSSRSGNGYTIVVRAPLAAMAVNPWRDQRVIYAVGTYNIGTNIPAVHGTTTADRGEAVVNFYSVVSVNGSTPVPGDYTTGGVNVTLPPGAQVVTTSPSFTSAEGIGYSWQVQSTGSTATDVIDFTMSLSRDQYVSMGVSPQEMDGPMVACYVDPTTAVPYCSDWNGIGLVSIEPKTQVSAILSSSKNARRQGAGYTVTVRFKAVDLNIGTGSQRVIFATGPYSTISDSPGSHSTTERSSANVNFYAGTASELGTNEGFTIALIIIIVVSCLALLVAAILNITKMVFGPVASMLLRGSVCVIYVFFLALYFSLNLRDYELSVKSWPVARALGDCAVMSFWFVLWPVPKHFGITTAVGASWERLLNYHIWVGTGVMLFSTAHFIAVLLMMKDTTAETFSTKGPFPALYGFIAWLLTVIMCLFSLFLRRKFYAMFRLLHWLYIPIIVFAVLHHPKLLWAFLPPLVNLFFDYCFRLYRHCTTGARIDAVTPIPGAKTALLRIKVAPNAVLPSYGEYVFIGVEGARNLHPYTVAWVEGTDRDNTTLTILVKSMGEGTWSDKVYQMATQNAIPVGSPVIYDGPYGSLQVPLASTQHLFLVCGGIGVTPMLGLLQEISRGNGEPKSITVVWSLREMALLGALSAYFQECARAVLGRMGRTKLTLQVHCTGKVDDSEKAKTAPFIFIAGRPNLETIMGEIVLKETDTSAIYVCGPQSLTDDCEKVARHRKNTYFHSELFEF